MHTPTATTFAELGLPVLLVQSLNKAQLTVPFPIQAQVIPDALAVRDILGKAPTGSGKTFAFGLPMLARLTRSASKANHPRGLILAPTRELADQIFAALDGHAAALGLRMATITGGVPMDPQASALGRAPDIVVATPGRLIDHIKRRNIHLGEVVVAVLDEADQMCTLGFVEQVSKIWDRTPSTSQRMLFSATLDGTVDALVARYLRDPTVCADASAKPEHKHHVLTVTRADLDGVVARIAARPAQTLFFTPTKHLASRIAEMLRGVGVVAESLHSDMTQPQRTAALQGFRDGKTAALVTTDVAARGIDIEGINLVVHVHPPRDATAYTHRAGRTARAGATGTVLTLATPADTQTAVDLLNEAGFEATVRAVAPRDPLLTEVAGARKPPGHHVADAPVPAATKPKPKPYRRTGPYRAANSKGKVTPIALGRNARPMRGGKNTERG